MHTKCIATTIIEYEKCILKNVNFIIMVMSYDV